jgi:hypothetical protein
MNYLSSHDGGPFDAARTKTKKRLQSYYFPQESLKYFTETNRVVL